MVLPDYSKSKADIPQPTPPTSSSSIENHANTRRSRSDQVALLDDEEESVELDLLDAKVDEFASSSAARGPSPHPHRHHHHHHHQPQQEDRCDALEGSLASLGDLFDHEEVEEDVTDQSSDHPLQSNQSSLNAASDLFHTGPTHNKARPKLQHAGNFRGLSKSVPDFGYHHNDQSENHHHQRRRKPREKVALMQGATTEDLCSEMKALGASMSRINVRGGPSASTAANQPSKSLSSSSLSPQRIPQRSKSHDGDFITRAHNSTSSGMTATSSSSRKGGRKMIPLKSKSFDASSDRFANMTTSSSSSRLNPPTSSEGMGPSSFVTGSRIRRIQPGTSGALSRDNYVTRSNATLKGPARSTSPVRTMMRSGNTTSNSKLES